MDRRRLLVGVFVGLVGLSVFGCGNSKKQEEGRAQLVQGVAEQLQAAKAKADAYNFDGAKAILRDLPEQVDKSPFADVATYDKLTADIEAVRENISEQESEYRKKIRAGWKLIDSRLVSPAEQERALAENRLRKEEDARRADEQRRAAEACAREEERKNEEAARRKAEEERRTMLLKEKRRKAAIAAITAYAPPPARKGTLTYEVDQASKELHIPPDDVRITISKVDDEFFGHKKGYIHVWILLDRFYEQMCRGWPDREKERVMDAAASAALKWLRANALDDPPVAPGLTIFFAEHWKRYALTREAL